MEPSKRAGAAHPAQGRPVWTAGPSAYCALTKLGCLEPKKSSKGLGQKDRD